MSRLHDCMRPVRQTSIMRRRAHASPLHLASWQAILIEEIDPTGPMAATLKKGDQVRPGALPDTYLALRPPLS